MKFSIKDYRARSRRLKMTHRNQIEGIRRSGNALKPSKFPFGAGKSREGMAKSPKPIRQGLICRVGCTDGAIDRGSGVARNNQY
jgi:hypothetical protein